MFRFGSIGIVLLLCCSEATWSCPVPVFRFALEKWKPAPFEVTIYSQVVLSAKDQEVVRRLDEPNLANLRVTGVDLNGTPTPEQRKRWESLGPRRPLPFATIAYPEADDRPLFWSGPLAELNIAELIQSPARRQITERLLSGDAIVFILLDGPDKAANDAAAALLQKELPRLAKVTHLPDPSQKGPQVESPLPLKIAFSHLRLSPAARGEGVFVQMLRRCKPGVEGVRGPVVLPVFGRGRVLDALHGDDVSPEMLVKVVDFLFGACTCQVKDGNPGLDLLFSVDWDSKVFPDNGVDTGEPVAAPQSAADAAESRPPTGTRRWLWIAFVVAAMSTVGCGIWAARKSTARHALLIRIGAMGFRIHPAWWFFGASGLVLAGLAVALFAPGWFSAKNTDGGPVVVYCAAAMRAPMEQIAGDYERETGGKVEIRFGASESILASIRTTKQGDLFFPADDSYIDAARDRNLIAPETIPVARMTAVLAVATGNPKHIESWADLLDGPVTLAQAEPDAAAIGKLTREGLTKQRRWDAVAKKTTVKLTTVTEVANAVALGSVDAGIVWDAVARPNPRLEIVALPGLDAIKARVQIAVLRTSGRPAAALGFARFLSAPDKGLKRFRDNGFAEVETGDAASLKPELVFYAGAMLKPAVEKTITDFERREGVTVTRVYNGCGILVSQMKTGERPDLFFACDTRFMEQAREWFSEPEVISSNQLVIAVQKGNPHGVKSLSDLAKPGLKVGVGHEQQCALGAITRDTFIQTGTYAAVAKNIVVQSPTGDLLVNQLRPGALDAAVVYRSNVLPYEKDLDYTPVTGIACATVEQPIAVGKQTEYPRLTARLIEAIRSAESRQRFEEIGFGWGAK